MAEIEKKAFSDPHRFICIYPLYLNAKKTLENGRKIPKERAIDDPTVQEIYDILKHAGLNVSIEKTKMHPRDQNRESNFIGRIRVQLKNDDGSLCNENFKSRKSMLLHAAEMIPKLKSRQPDAVAGSSSSQQTAGGKKKKR